MINDTIVPIKYYKCLACQYLKITEKTIVSFFECTNKNGEIESEKCEAYKRKEE